MESNLAERAIRAASAILGVLLAALVLTACANSGAKSASQAPATPRTDATPSEAMNVLLAAGLVKDAQSGSVRDMPKGSMPQEVGQSGPGWVDVGWAASNAISPPAGIGGGAALGISAISLLLPDPVDPLASSWVIAWMPKQDASTPGAAKARMRQMLDEALLMALKSELPRGYRVVAKNDGLPGRTKIGGGICDTKGVHCFYHPQMYAEPMLTAIPKFAGGGSGWSWPHGVGAAVVHPGVYDDRGFGFKILDTLPDARIYTAFSRRLPKWAYFYLAPGKVSLGPGKGLNKAPVVINQGRPLYFVSR